jgi:hypothetical protein
VLVYGKDFAQLGVGPADQIAAQRAARMRRQVQVLDGRIVSDTGPAVPGWDAAAERLTELGRPATGGGPS